MKINSWRKRVMKSAKNLDSHCGASIGFKGCWVWRHYSCVSIALWLSVCSAGCKVFSAWCFLPRSSSWEIMSEKFWFQLGILLRPISSLGLSFYSTGKRWVTSFISEEDFHVSICSMTETSDSQWKKIIHSLGHFSCISPRRKTRNHGFEFRHFEFTHRRRDEAAGVPLASGRAECRLPDGELRVQAKTRW